MSDTQPGWHPDPTNPQQLRWWGGSQWTEHVAPYPGTLLPRPQVAPGTPLGTPWVWIMAVLPIVTIGLGLIPHAAPRFTTQYGVRELDPSSIYTPLYFARIGIGLVIYGVNVVLAWLDRRELMRRGVVRPFHWAWTFLGGIVYVIGRSVILHGVAQGRGKAPMWVMIGLTALGIVVGVVMAISSLSAAFPG